MNEPIIIGNVVVKQVETGVRIEDGWVDGIRWVFVPEEHRLAVARALLPENYTVWRNDLLTGEPICLVTKGDTSTITTGLGIRGTE